MKRVRNKEVAYAWAVGERAKSHTGAFWTDGICAYSYGLRLAYWTPALGRVVKLYRAPFAFESVTTSTHVTYLLATRPNNVENPQTGEIRSFAHYEVFNDAECVDVGELLRIDISADERARALAIMRKTKIPFAVEYYCGFYKRGVFVPGALVDDLRLLISAKVQPKKAADILSRIWRGEQPPTELELLRAAHALTDARRGSGVW